ncbi:glycine cleavage system aminomethyltransferase GcvT [Telmatocola sphagniphila]|uniref:Aminomethyltransferase n=1 Tax=Telmatocola sphagniphila TaxID=1123043 RepID=A0A8E6B2D5_9BACT|nr:glycine cleavage system aminomethyltransferase GcvT [Telmatocola sphagniphila]QVL30134.1 glycine cleavage system aminomethyltransferase GcvT [Telmatocola sphagniphila]
MANLRTPLYDWHISQKARMVPFGGWDMPVQYKGVMDEHKAVRNSAGMFDVSHMARFSFGGPDALALIDEIFTNSAAGMKDFQVRYGLVCNESGGMLDDILVYRWPYGWAMVVNASNRIKILDWLNAKKGDRNVTIQDQTLATCMVAVQGPKAVELCKEMFADPIEDLKYYYARPTKYLGQNCVVSRTGYTGEDGIEIMVGAAQANTLADALLAKGVVPCGLGCRDTLRLEAAMPLYGHELNETTDPLSAGLSWAVKLEKPSFIGKEALAQKKAAGLPAVRMGLEIEGKRAAREGCPVLIAGKQVGVITSGSFSPTLEKSIAMAMLPAGTTSCEVDIRGTITPAKVVPLPFYKRAK